MTTRPHATEMPPVKVVLSEVVTTLALAAHAYLERPDSPGAPPDFESAELAIDAAAATFERIQPRLSSEERVALASLLTELRMTFVRKRGL